MARLLNKKTVAFICGALLAVGGTALVTNGAVNASAAENQAENIILLDAGHGELQDTSIALTKEGTLPQLPTPTRAGWEFVGWFDREVVENFWGDEESENVAEDYKALKDKYGAKAYKNVLYQGAVTPVEQLDNDSDRGWKELTFNWVCITEGEQVHEGEKISEGQTLYAMYRADRYTVYWHLNGWLNTYDGINTAHRTLPEHGGYFVNYKLDEFPSLQWANHEFLGWYKDPACTQEYKFNGIGQYQINDEQVYGDVHLYAKWQSSVPFDGEIRLNKMSNLVEPKLGETFTVNCSYLLGASKDKPVITAWESSVDGVALVSSGLYSAQFSIENTEIFKDGNKHVTFFVTVDGEKYPAAEVTIGHSWDKTVREIGPTCTEAGKTVYGCKFCGETKTVEHAANGHRLIKTVHPATCIEDEYVETHCIVCGLHETEVFENSRLGHSLSTHTVANCNGTTTITTCVNCGLTETTFDETAVVHDWESHYTTDRAATCSTDGEQSIHCRNCDVKKEVQAIPATGEHVWGDWRVEVEPTTENEGVSSRSCNVCGESETQTIPTLTAEPEVPEVTEPEEPEVTEPEVTEPEVPEVTEPEEPEVTVPEVPETEEEVTEPEVAVPETKKEAAAPETKKIEEIVEDNLEDPTTATVFGTQHGVADVQDVQTVAEVKENSKLWIIAVAACVAALVCLGIALTIKRRSKTK